MKFTAYILAIIVVGYLGHLFLPWWSIILVAGIIGAFTKYSGIRAFAVGFLGVALLWGIYAILINNQNDGIMASRLGELLGNMKPLALIAVTALLGGFLGGMGALTGNLGRKLVS